MCVFCWRTCKALQSVSSRREDAGRNRRHPDGIGANADAARCYETPFNAVQAARESM